MRKRYAIEYATGKRFRLSGVFKQVRISEDTVGPAIFDCNEEEQIKDVKTECFLLDPRAIVRDQTTREVVYNPRDHESEFGGLRGMIWVFDWLQENPRWGRTRHLETGKPK